MKNFYFIFLIVLMLTGCHSVDSSDLKNLNGYWGIEKVIQPDGKEIDFKTNIVYDYYEFDEDLKGFYKKATPQLDGTFIVDDFQDNIEIIKQEGDYIIKFHSEFDDREVVILDISQDKMSFRNQDNKTYYYRRAKPLKIDL